MEIRLPKGSRGLILSVISAVFWGTYGTFLRLMGDIGFRNMTIAAMGPTIVVVFFLLKVLWIRPQALLIKGKFLILLAFHGMIITGGGNFSYVKAVSTLPVAIVSIISFCHVILLMISTRVVFGYKITAQKVAASLVVLFGLTFVLEIYRLTGSLSGTGLFWAGIQALLLAIGYTMLKYYITNGIESMVAFFYTNCFAALTLWCSTPPWRIAGEAVQLALTNGPGVWLIILGFILIPLIGAYLSFGKAYELIEPTYVSIMYSLDPVTAAILGFLVLGQRISVMQLVGMIVILIPVAYIQYKEGKEGTTGEKLSLPQ